MQPELAHPAIDVPLAGSSVEGCRQAASDGMTGMPVMRFAARVKALSPASPALQAHLLEEIKSVAGCIDASAEQGLPSGYDRPGYDRRVLWEDPGRWSLALIILRPGQHTETHNHDGWGAAVTVQGIERNRRFLHDASGKLAPAGEVDYPPGTGYVFDATEVHQPTGADPQRVTVALHFLVHEEQPEEPEAEPVGNTQNRVQRYPSCNRL